MMPEMSGWEVCRRLKANPVTTAIPVIMLTGSSSPTLAEEAARCGVMRVLTKPCSAEALTAALLAVVPH